ncbi:hypothetical protein J6590_076534 [Homalodisca vitripennis]|nr:hypothetical protein J6590_076534 [Homalodisca vitripennis]
MEKRYSKICKKLRHTERQSVTATPPTTAAHHDYFDPFPRPRSLTTSRLDAEIQHQKERNNHFTNDESDTIWEVRARTDIAASPPITLAPKITSQQT